MTHIGDVAKLRARCLALLLPGLVLTGCDAGRSLDNATRYAAHMSCSCVYVAGRDLQACLADLPSGAEWLEVSNDYTAKEVTARALWVRGTAYYSEGRGCRLAD